MKKVIVTAKGFALSFLDNEDILDLDSQNYFIAM